MFHFCGIRPHGSGDGAGLLPDVVGPRVEDLVTDREDGAARHVIPIGGFTVVVDGTPVVGARRAGWLLATEARLVFCIPSYIQPSSQRPLNGLIGVAARAASRSRAASREAGTVYAGHIRWEHLARVAAARPANRRVWETEPDELSVEATEAITDPRRPQLVRITWPAIAATGDVHALASWLARATAHHRLARTALDPSTRDALAALAGGPPPVPVDHDGASTVSLTLPGAATATGPAGPYPTGPGPGSAAPGAHR